MKNLGFTLVELLIVMAILAILASLGFSQYRTSQQKARDAQRKADLSNVARALEMYYNDNSQYPVSTDCSSQEVGKMVVNKNCPQETVLDWGQGFEVEINNSTIVYMKRLPQDPKSSYSYCYESSGGNYRLFSILENSHDRDYNKFNPSGYSCHGAIYNYGISSSNISLQ